MPDFAQLLAAEMSAAHPVDLAIGHPAGEVRTAFAAADFLRKHILPAVSFVGTEGVSGFHELLRLLKHSAADHCFMGAGNVIAVFLTLVAYRPEGHRVGGVGFLQQGIADVALTFKNIADGGVLLYVNS